MKCVMFSLFVCFLLVVRPEIYFEEEFENDSRWTRSAKKPEESADMKLAKRTGSEKDSAQGFRTTKNEMFYHYSAPTKMEFNTAGKDLVFEFMLRHEQQLTCGGGYIKLLLDDYGKDFEGQSEYAIMFGPDACGHNKYIHVIFSHGNENILKTQNILYNFDQLLHVYTLIVSKDKTYEVLVDGESKGKGKIINDWELFGKKEIDDPNDVKPIDWVDEAEIIDKDAKKPEDWVEQEFIPDSNAKKPEEWVDEDDGEWVVPTITNPDFKGEWTAPFITNPDYKGPFVSRKIPNPEYKPDDNYCEYVIKGVGIDIWQVESGSIFDRVILTDNLEEAEKFRQESLNILKEENEAQKNREKEEKTEETPKDDEPEEEIGQDETDEL